MAYIKSCSFLQLFGDAIFHAHAAQECDVQPTAMRHARSSILSAAISVECAANCCIAIASISRRCRNEFDKLNPLGKFEAFARIEGKEVGQDRNEWNRIAGLVKLRNAYVHPKKRYININLDAVSEKTEGTIVKLSWSGSTIESLGVDKNSFMWFPENALTMLKTVVEFFNYFFVDVMQFTKSEILGILCPLLILDEEKPLVFQQECFAEDLRLLDNMLIKNRFFDLATLPLLATGK